ncbi:MAG: VTT domain-containing protein [Lachnospiraceae bacterium]|nr:VTT domain-containing protein [Lachnospiraceae bacterium]
MSAVTGSEKKMKSEKKSELNPAQKELLKKRRKRHLIELVCAEALYGKLTGVIMCFITNLVTNVLIFFAARRFWISTREFDKIEHNPLLEEWINHEKYPGLLVFMMCVVPVIPNGMIPYISAQAGVSLPAFAGALSLGSLLTVILFVCCGDLLLSEHFRVSLPLIGVLLIVILIGLLFRKKIIAWIRPRLRKLLKE